MSAVLVEIISLLVAGITELATGIGEGLSTLVQSIFLEVAEGGGFTLSTFGGVIVIFAAISLAVGLSRLVVRWVMSLGGRK